MQLGEPQLYVAFLSLERGMLPSQGMAGAGLYLHHCTIQVRPRRESQDSGLFGSKTFVVVMVEESSGLVSLPEPHAVPFQGTLGLLSPFKPTIL